MPGSSSLMQRSVLPVFQRYEPAFRGPQKGTVPPVVSSVSPVMLHAGSVGLAMKLTVSDAGAQTLGDWGVTVNLAQYTPGASTTAVVLQLPGAVNRGLDPAGWQ